MIYYIPLGDNQTASSRLRVHNIRPYLESSLELPDRYTKDDVLIIQKVHCPNELHKAQSAGAKVVFDCDENYAELKGYAGMLNNADAVTTDTTERKIYLEKYTKRPIYVVPDTLDWDGITRAEDVKNNTACWTSYGNNAGFIEGIKLPMTLRLITTPDYKNYFTGKCEFVQWDINTVDDEIRKCEIMVIPLPDNEVTKPKGRHKLLKAWANGVKCYTSAIPDYLESMRDAGVGDKYIVKDWDNFKPSDLPLEVSCVEFAKRYKAGAIAKLWKDVILKV
jgi:hypothetical protein